VVAADTVVVASCDTGLGVVAARNSLAAVRWYVAEHLAETMTASLARHHWRNCARWGHQGLSRQETVGLNLVACCPRG